MTYKQIAKDLNYCLNECCSEQDFINVTRNALEFINCQNAEIIELRRIIDELKLEMSYMKAPNTIGDRHEMGCW